MDLGVNSGLRNRLFKAFLRTGTTNFCDTESFNLLNKELESRIDLIKGGGYFVNYRVA